MTTKWEFLDHPDGTEAPYLYDDQTPPSYVEKTSAGVWSLVKTGNLANREDQLAGNNWDYISDNGTTVSFYFKSWDAGGYWSGPYLRATWFSNSSGDTITVTNVNNGNFYLKQPASSSGAGTLSTSTLYSISQSGNKVVAFVGGGNPTQGQLYIGDNTGPRTVGHSHTTGTDTTIEWSPISPGVYNLLLTTGTGYTPLASVTVTATSKKVSCNFW